MPTPGTSDRTITVATWGGPYEHSQEMAYFEPFTNETGIRIETARYGGGLDELRRQVGAGGGDLGSPGHDHGRQPRRLPAGAAGTHRSLDAAPRPRRHPGRRGLRRRRAHRVRGLADRLCHGGGVQPRRLSGRTSGPHEGHLRPPALSREACAAEAPGGESRMGAPIVRGAARGPLPVAEHGGGGFASRSSGSTAFGTRSSGGRPSSSRWSCSSAERP